MFYEPPKRAEPLWSRKVIKLIFQTWKRNLRCENDQDQPEHQLSYFRKRALSLELKIFKTSVFRLQYIYFNDDSIITWLDVIKGMFEDYIRAIIWKIPFVIAVHRAYIYKLSSNHFSDKDEVFWCRARQTTVEEEAKNNFPCFPWRFWETTIWPKWKNKGWPRRSQVDSWNPLHIWHAALLLHHR